MCISFFHQASNIWMEKLTKDDSYIETLRNMMEDLEIPENLFMNL